MCRKLTCLASFVLLLSGVNIALALEPIANVTATASSSQVTMEPENTVNSSGLNGSDEHSAIDTDMWLSDSGDFTPWIQYEFDKTYKLEEMWVWNYNHILESFLGFGAKDVAIEYSTNGAEWIFLKNAEFAQAPGEPGYTANTIVDFHGVAVKYVRLTIQSNWGAIMPQSGLSEVRFFFISTFAGEPQPADGALHTDTWVNLSWEAGDFAVSHDIYMGDNFDDVNNAMQFSDVFRGNQGLGMEFYIAGFAPYAYPEGLVNDTTYYWRIDEVNDANPNSPWRGDVWSFTVITEPVPPPDPVINLSPDNGATDQSVDVILYWMNGGGAESYRVYFGTDADAVANASTTSPEYKGPKDLGDESYDPSNLMLNSTYYWRIDATNSSGTTVGEVWSFTTEELWPPLPFKPINPSPVNGAPDQPIDVILSWMNGGYATSYRVYFGTNPIPDSSMPQGIRIGTSYDPSPIYSTLNYSTTYYWQIDAMNTSGSTKGDIWSFTTEPPLPPLPSKTINPRPANGATEQSVDVILRWDNGGYAASYRVYFGMDADAVANATTASPEYKEPKNLGDESYDPSNLMLNSTYYWRIDATNSSGTTKGDLWSFTTGPPLPPLPFKPINPHPANGATDQSIDVNLNWMNGGGATSYRVYFGTNPIPDSSMPQGIRIGTSYDPSPIYSTLNYSTTYYWQIDAMNTSGSTEGDVWSFTTEAFLPPPQETAAYDPDPPDGAIGIDPNITLSWKAGFSAELHNVYFGSNFAIVDEGSRGTDQGTTETTSFVPGPLELGTTYYWRIDEVNEANPDSPWRGDVWSFTIRQPGETAYDPYPPDNATEIDPNVTLRWKAGFGAESHHVYFGGNFTIVDKGSRGTDQGTTETTSFVPGTLELGNTYYWRVNEVDVNGAVAEGDIWSFTIRQPGETAYDPYPPNNATEVDPNVILRWKAGFSAESHHVYFGGNVAIVDKGSRGTDQGTTETTSFVPGPLELGTTYYWRIDEVNEANPDSPWKGDIWSFTTESTPLPSKPINPNPDNGTTNQSIDLILSWVNGGGAESYRVYFGTDADAVANASTTSPEYKGPKDLGDESYDPSNLMLNSTYYWRIDATNSTGTTEGDVWSFTTGASILQTAYDPDPPDNARFIEPNVEFSWMAGQGAITHDVYLGTDEDAVKNATEDSPEYKANKALGDESYNPGLLELDKRYYWRVDEFDGVDTHKGDVWSFAMVHRLDDFENYSNEEDERIFDFWADGGGWASRPPVEDPCSNFTGAIVGHDIWSPGTPYTTIMETKIVFSGEQSMPLYYNNENPPFYSQADYTFPTPQNWTDNFNERLLYVHNQQPKFEEMIGSVNVLTLYVHGQPPKFEETLNGGLLLSGAGSDIWGTSDEFRFLYKVLNGNGSITARVVSNGTGSSTWAKGGVMIRESLESSSPHAMTVITGGNGGGSAFQWRPFASSDSYSAHNPTPAVSPPYWVRIERKGNALRGYLSPDGVNWIQQGQTETIDMWGAAVFIGLCVTSNVSSELRTYEFDNIDTTGIVLGEWEAEDVGVDQPANDPASLYIRLEDTTGNVAVVFHPDPDPVLTNDWNRWMIPLRDFSDAGVDLSSVMKMSIGIGESTSPPPPQDLRLFDSLLFDNLLFDNPSSGSNGRIWIDEISVTAEDYQDLWGYVRNRLTGEPITNAYTATVAWRWANGTVDIAGDYVDSTGFYQLLLDPGEIKIVVRAVGFQTSFPELQRGSQALIERDFLLIPDSEPDPPINYPIYRFLSPDAYSYYFAADESIEMETLLYDDEPFDPDNWTYNGIAFYAEAEGNPNALPVYRFLREDTDVPAYAFAEADLPGELGDWTKDYYFDASAFAFSAYPPYIGVQETDPEGQEPAGTKPVYCFWSDSLKCHFYTINESEKNDFLAISDWTYKGVAWYAYDEPKP